jgi:NADPH:quinone reductase-like Zn-dependent oxidoreductase
MLALHVPAAGQQPQLSDVPVPDVTEGTLLIRVKAAGLNPIDNGIAAGLLSTVMPHYYPVILGRDVGPGLELPRIVP